MDELKKLLAGSVPLIASVLGTANPIAGILFSAVAHMFGLNTDATPEQVTQAVQADPDHDVKLRTLEVQHQDDLINAQVAIRQGAYTREAEVVKATGKRDWVMDFLAVFVTVGFFALCLIIKFTILDPSDKDLFYMLIGTFSSGWSIVLAYYFGATKSKTPPISSKPDLVLPPPAVTR